MNKNKEMIFAYLLDGQGGGKDLTFDEVKAWKPGDGILWAHFNYTGRSVKSWLLKESGIDPLIVEALSEEETRPRSLVHKAGMLVILRGVNLSPNNDPEDMISVRCWIDANRIISMRNRRVLGINDLREETAAGNGPTGPGHFLTELTDRMINRMGTVIADVDDTVDAFEDEVISAQSNELRQKIANIRRTVIGMRRYLSPQRDVMLRLQSETVEWLSDINRMRLREIGDRTTRYVEDLDAIRDRATLTQEELNHRLSEQMNKTMYILSMITGIFLPLGLLTGLFGINIGGMPGVDNEWAFGVFCVVLIVIASIQFWFFKKKKWM